MTPEVIEDPICELCLTPGLVAELPFRRAKTRRVCVVCLAAAIERRTGWRMRRQVEQYIQASADAPKLRAMALAAQEVIRAEAAASYE